MIYTTLSTIALVAEAILLVYVIAQVSLKKTAFSKKTLWYSIPIFVLVYYIYVVGYSYTDNEITPLFFITLISNTLAAFAFKVELGYVTNLAVANPYYLAATTIAFVYAGATLVASIIGLAGAQMKNNIRVRQKIGQRKTFVLGISDTAKSYARDNDAVLVCIGAADKVKDLIKNKYTVLATSDGFGAKSELRKIVKKYAKAGEMLHFVAFAEDIKSHEALINAFIDGFKTISEVGFTLHVEATIGEMDIINRKFIDKKTAPNVCVKSFNKYELIARKFIKEEHISKYLPDDFYGKYRTIKDDKKINVVFLGFGRVNCEIMRLMVVQNQFVGLSVDRFRNFPVNYYVYDNSEDKIYSDTILTIRSDIKRMAKKDLPLPEPICNIADVRRFNVLSEELSDKLHSVIIDKDAFTYLIVSIGSDLENVALAERFANIYNGYGSNLKVFARTTSNNIANTNDIVCFGNERNILSDDVIVDEALDNLSRSTDDKYRKLSSSGVEAFNTKPTIEKYSNIYHSLSLFHKMGMLGYTYVPKSELGARRVVDKKELYEAFGALDESNDYNKYFELSVWNMLGFSEHSRWEAQYILNGFHPLSLDAITFNVDNGKVSHSHKNIDARLHACITDYYGLDVLHRFLAAKYKELGSDKTIEDLETYRYDYMLVDSGYDEMLANGYVLVAEDR